MKVLSIKQPYAELILKGVKKIEYRTWDTTYRGEFLIHASLKPEKDTGAHTANDIDLETLDYGKIVGIVNLVDVEDYEIHGYGWVLINPRRIKPIKHKGQLSFWNYEGNIEVIE